MTYLFFEIIYFAGVFVTYFILVTIPRKFKFVQLLIMPADRDVVFTKCLVAWWWVWILFVISVCVQVVRFFIYQFKPHRI